MVFRFFLFQLLFFLLIRRKNIMKSMSTATGDEISCQQDKIKIKLKNSWSSTQKVLKGEKKLNQHLKNVHKLFGLVEAQPSNNNKNKFHTIYLTFLTHIVWFGVWYGIFQPKSLKKCLIILSAPQKIRWTVIMNVGWGRKRLKTAAYYKWSVQKMKSTLFGEIN